jgi:hypothetical protein
MPKHTRTSSKDKQAYDSLVKVRAVIHKIRNQLLMKSTTVKSETAISRLDQAINNIDDTLRELD